MPRLMQTCPKCGVKLQPATRSMAFEVASRTIRVDVPISTCPTCGAGYGDARALEVGQLQVACALATDLQMDGAAFRFMRKTLGLRATDLATALDLTPETISRWENGQRKVDRAAWIVVGSLVLEKAEVLPRTLARVMSLAAKPDGEPEDTRDSSAASSAPGPVSPTSTGPRKKRISGEVLKLPKDHRPRAEVAGRRRRS